MDISEQLLRELQKLQELYKTNFDLVSQKVESQAEILQKQVMELQEAKNEFRDLSELLKEVIAEKDVQVQRLMKAVAALTVVTNQITERFQAHQ